MGSGGAGSAPAPDPKIGIAALKNAQLGEDWLAFAKDAYATAQTRQKPIDALSQEIAQQQLQTSKQQNQFAQEAHDRYVNQFEPLQDRYIQEAENYDTPEKEAAAAAAAKADVIANANAARAATNRQAIAMGVNPNSGRFAGINRATDLGTSVAAAGAENQARNQVKATGLALKGSAINVGNGLPAQSAQSTGLGLNAGTGAANVTNAANGQFLASTGIMNNGFQGAMAGYNNEATILQNQYNSQLQAYEFNQQMGAANTQGILGTVGSIAGLMLSSKKFKTGRKPANGNLAAVKKMPVQTYRYKPGIADGGAMEHTGPMAEDFQKATGRGDGTMIPMQDAIGITMGAVKELSDHVDKIGKAVGVGPIAKVKGTKPPKIKNVKPPKVAAHKVHLPKVRPMKKVA